MIKFNTFFTYLVVVFHHFVLVTSHGQKCGKANKNCADDELCIRRICYKTCKKNRHCKSVGGKCGESTRSQSKGEMVCCSPKDLIIDPTDGKQFCYRIKNGKECPFNDACKSGLCEKGTCGTFSKLGDGLCRDDSSGTPKSTPYCAKDGGFSSLQSECEAQAIALEDSLGYAFRPTVEACIIFVPSTPTPPTCPMGYLAGPGDGGTQLTTGDYMKDQYPDDACYKKD